MFSKYIQPFIFGWLTFITALLVISIAILSVIDTHFVLSNYARIRSDEYGLADGDRTDLASVAVDYLLNGNSAENSISMLSQQKTPDGELLYTPEELSHMIDVKNLTDRIRGIPPIALLTISIFLGIAVLSPRYRNQECTLKQFQFGKRKVDLLLLPKGSYLYKIFAFLKRGMLLSGIFGISILLFAALFWRQFFVFFHEVFFPPNSWTFDASSGLIRLFPEAFWFSVGTGLIGRIITFSIIGYLFIFIVERLYFLSHRFLKEASQTVANVELLTFFSLTILPFGFLTHLINFANQIHQLRYNLFYIFALLLSLLIAYLPYRNLHHHLQTMEASILNEEAFQFTGTLILLLGVWALVMLRFNHPFLIFISGGYLMATIAFLIFGVLPIWNEVIARLLPAPLIKP